jgi:transcriptional regulator with XRE-family HTH domain
MFLGEKVRQLREARGLSQEQLARLSECSIWTIHRIETGKVTPLASTLARIAVALGENPGFFGIWILVRPKRRVKAMA